MHEGKEVSTHPRLRRRGAYSTQKAHMSSAHQKYLEWSPGRIMSWGLSVGPNTAKLLQTIMERRPHPEMGYRSCLGVMREFEKQKNRPDGMSEEALDAIAEYAMKHQKFRLKQIRSLLQSLPKDDHTEEDPGLFALAGHDNIRGSDYYR
jgi:hypothetical protein